LDVKVGAADIILCILIASLKCFKRYPNIS